MPASAASIIADLANFAGTKITEVSAAVSLIASSTELNTGLPRCSCPPLFGVTPPTTFVPVSYTHLTLPTNREV